MKEMLQKGKGIRSILGAVLCLMMCLAVMPALPAHAVGPAPTVTWGNDCTVSWTPIEGADHYYYTLAADNNEWDGSRVFAALTEETKLDLSEYMFPGNEYRFSVCARDSKSNNITQTGWKYYTMPGETEKGLTITLDGNYIRWPSVPNANVYGVRVRLGGELVELTSIRQTMYNLASLFSTLNTEELNTDGGLQVEVCACRHAMGNVIMSGKTDIIPVYKVVVEDDINKSGKDVGNGFYFPGQQVQVKAFNEGQIDYFLFDEWTVAGMTLPDSKRKLADITFTMPNNDVHFTANWARGTKVVFHCNGGTMSDEFMEMKTNGWVLDYVPTPYREGYNFLGWTLDEPGGKDYLHPNTTLMIQFLTLNYYANWSAKIAVTFDFNDGTGYKKVMYADKDGKLLAAGSPKSEGKKFLGWFTTPNAGGEQVTPSTLTFTADTTLYAHWETLPIDTTTKYTVTVNGLGVGGGVYDYDMIPTTEFKEGEIVTITLGKKEGYVITRVETDCPNTWFPGYVEFRMPADNITVDIKWMNLNPTVGAFTYALKSLQVDGYKYQATITGAEGLSGDVKIPSVIAVDDMPVLVTAIDGSVFKVNKNITSVYLPDSIGAIDTMAFAGCSSLEEVRFPGNLSEMYVSAATFAQCTSLRKVTLPTSWKYIPKIFASRKSLEEVVIPASVMKIEENAFANCTGLRKVVFGGSKAQWETLISDENCGAGNDALKNEALVVECRVGALAITSQPVNQTAAVGEEVTFTVAATGEGLKYQWKKSTDGGKTWPNSSSTGATTDTLSMTTKESYNGLQFKCVVTDKYGKTVESKAATLTVVAAGTLAITTQPKDVAAAAGQEVVFTVKAIGEGLKYQWKKSKDGGKNWSDSSSTGATTDTLTMTMQASYNGLQFKCIVTDAKGKSLETKAVTLTLSTGGIEPKILTPPPTGISALSGNIATIQIKAEGEGLKYQWQKSTDGGKTWVNSSSTGATTNTLSMTTKASFSGLKFRCIVTDKNGKSVTSSAATLTVTAAGALAITTQPANATVAAGANVTFKIAATGDTLKYQWKKSTDGGKTWANSSSTGATTNTLSMATKASYNGLQFKCVVTDKNGKTVTSNAATLKVTAAAALAITAQPSDTIVLVGATAIFKITATGDTLKYQWKKSTDGGKSWVNSSSTGATTNTLSMATKASYDGLQFKCVVTDKNGKTVTSNAATLKIASSAPGGVTAPAITTQPSNVTVTAGATATFKIAATGTGLKYQWKKSTDGGKTWVNSSSTGCTSNTLSMATKASFNGIQFKCVVTDAAGKTVTSNAATLTVK